MAGSSVQIPICLVIFVDEFCLLINGKNNPLTILYQCLTDVSWIYGPDQSCLHNFSLSLSSTVILDCVILMIKTITPSSCTLFINSYLVTTKTVAIEN